MVGVVRHAPHLSSGSQSGMLSALSFVSACICIVHGGLLADFLLSRKILRLNTIRKLFTAIGKNQGRYGGGVGCGMLREASYSLCLLSCPRGSPPICVPRVPFLGQIQLQCHHGLLDTVFCHQKPQPIRSPCQLHGYCSSVETCDHP